LKEIQSNRLLNGAIFKVLFKSLVIHSQYSCDHKAEFSASLLQFSVSRDHSEIKC